MIQKNEMQKEFSRGTNIFILGIVFIAALIMWNSIFFFPIKLFVVALHELSHGIAAVIMGGEIKQIQIDKQIGGYCVTALPASAGFFKQAIVVSAGYLGSILWGALIFLLAVKNRHDRIITFFIGLLMAVITFYVFRTREFFGIAYTIIFTLFLFAASRWLPERFLDIMLKSLGFISCMYAIFDIKDDLIDRTHIGSDADRLAQMMGMPSISIVIGIIWIIFAVAVLGLTLRIAFKNSSGKTN